MFITLEGIKGAGKSLQANLLWVKLTEQFPDREILYFKEPKGTALGEHVEAARKDPRVKLSVTSDLLITAAARTALIEEKILPALNRGAIVICDKFLDSVIAYYQYGMNQDSTLINAVTKSGALPHTTTPNTTFLLKIDPEVAHARLQRHRSTGAYGDIPTTDLLRKVHTGFDRIITENNSDRFIIIDAEDNVENISEIIFEQTLQRLSKAEGMDLNKECREAKMGSEELNAIMQAEREAKEA